MYRNKPLHYYGVRNAISHVSRERISFMSKKFVLLWVVSCMFALMLLVWGQTSVFAQENSGGETNGYPTVTVDVTDISGLYDSNESQYIVVRRIRIDDFNKNTGVHHTHITVVRESILKEMGNTTCVDAPTAQRYSCYYKKSQIFTDTDRVSTHGQWIISYAKHYYNVYCRSQGDCIYSKPTKLKIWWQRNSTAWSVRNVKVKWGCAYCIKCSDGDFNYVYKDSFNGVRWQNNRTSYVYIYSSNTWPAMTRWDSGSWRAGSTSNAYHRGVYKKTLVTNAGLQ